VAANVAALLAGCVWFRFHALGNVPGINGDEAWYGVQAVELLRGGDFSWRTPPGNPLNPLFFLPVVGLHLLFGPSIAVLRCVSLASGLAALGLNWWLCRRLFGRRTAWISTVALAVLPINIAYSRFAWDASQSLLVTLPVLYCSLAAVQPARRFDRWLAAAIVAQLLALWVHPTNIFAGAAIAVAVGSRMAAFRFEPGKKRGQWARIAVVMALGGAALAVWAASIARAHAGGNATGRIEQIASLFRPDAIREWSALYARLFSGGTAYQYVAGTHSWLELGGLDVFCVWLLCGVSILLVFCRTDFLIRPESVDALGNPSYEERSRQDACSADRLLALTWLLQLAALLVLAGPLALLPGQERYAMCLIAPAVVLVSRGLAIASLRYPRAWPGMLAATLVAGWLLLADFHEHYFRFTERTGGQSHLTFRSATTEPKQAALEHVLAERGEGTAWIVTSEWWNYWPLRYLAAGANDVHVITPEEITSYPDVLSALSDGRVWYVEFVGSEGLAGASGGLAGHRVQEDVIRDYGGRPVLSVLRPLESLPSE
jgi:hypothetical protein